MRKIGYCRVSTAAQYDNTSLESQAAEILAAYADAEIINEVQSGATKRHLFASIIDGIEPGDLVISTKLDRFCRSTKEGLESIDAILSRGGRIHILNMGLIENTPLGRLIVTQLLAFAEFERAQIIERCGAGREKARLMPGYKDGRKPKFSAAQIEHALTLLNDYSYRRVAEMTGISRSTLARAVRKKAIEDGETNDSCK